MSGFQTPSAGERLALRSEPPNERCAEIVRAFAAVPCFALRSVDVHTVQESPIREATLWRWLEAWFAQEVELSKLSTAEREQQAARAEWSKVRIERRELGFTNRQGKLISTHWALQLGVCTVRRKANAALEANERLTAEFNLVRRQVASLLGIASARGIEVRLVGDDYIDVTPEPAPVGLFEAFDLREAS